MTDKQNKSGPARYVAKKRKTNLPEQPSKSQVAHEQSAKHKNLEKELKIRLRQQIAITELGQRALVGIDLSILLDEAVFSVTQTLGLEYAKIMELQPNNVLYLKAGYGWQADSIDQLRLTVNSDSQSGYAMLTGEALIVNDISQETRFSSSPLLKKHQVVSGMSVVIHGKDKPYGVLSGYTTQPRIFTEDDIHFLKAMANVLASAIERKQSEARMLRRNRELLTLQSANAAISSTLDLDYVLKTVTIEMANLLNVDTCFISSWNQTESTVTILASYGPDEGVLKEDLAPNTYPLAKYPLTKQVLTQQRIIQLTTSQPHIEPAQLRYMQKYNAKTLLMLPMVLQGRIIGIVNVVDTQTERVFTEQQIESAKFLAHQAARSIENARLYDEICRILKEQLALREARAAISSSLDLKTVLNRIAEQISQVLNVTSAYICDFEAETMQSTILAQYINPQTGSQEQPSRVGLIYNMLTAFPGSLENLQMGQPGVIHLDSPTLAKTEQARMKQLNIQTTLIIPIQAGGQVIGYANLEESRQQREFTSGEIALGQDIAQQAAIAIENARLFNQTEQALKDTDALYRVTRMLAQIENEQEMFKLVLIECLQSLNLQQGGVLLCADNQTDGILIAHKLADKPLKSDLHIPIENNPALHYLIEDKNPLIIHNTQKGELLKGAYALTLNQAFKSVLLIPLIIRGKVIAALRAEAVQDFQTFELREMTLVKAMADQLSIAIENIRLQAETKQRAEQLAVLHELDQAIATSLRPSDIYFTFAQHVTRILSYDQLSITQSNNSELIQISQVINIPESNSALSKKIVLPRQSSAIGWVVTHRQPLIRHNIPLNARYAEDKYLIADGLHSFMIIPLRIKGDVIGTWNVGSKQISAYGPDDLKMAQAIADQLVIAIENARLYGEIQQYLEELTTLNMIGQAITSTLNLEEMLTIITQHTVQLISVAAASVVLYDKIEDKLLFAAASGVDGDKVRGKYIELGQGIAGWVFKYDKAVLIPDVAQDQRFFDKFDKVSNFTTKSVLCVPLQTKGQTIGAIEVINKANAPFDQEDLRLLNSLAAPAATAIETARLYEQAQQEIAERKRVEATLEEERASLARRVKERTADLSIANQELARAARLKDEFLASMSHELRTPLTAILGLSEVLKARVYGPITEKQDQAIQAIETSGRHLLALINDILDLSKIEAGQLEVEIGPVSVELICQTSMQFVKQAAHKKQLKISSTLDSAVSTIQADERRLKQILVNLLSNAVKFTPPNGSIGIEVVGDKNRGIVNIIIWDSGIGISAQDKERLFQPFVQLDSSLSRQHAGTGLGLALVSRMVKLHNGSVSIESELGTGSRFIISLPWAEPSQLTQAASVEPSSPHNLNLATIERILLIEDSPSAADKLTLYLRHFGITTAAHPQADGAFEKVLEFNPHVIILDIILADASGWDVLKELKADPRTQHIPVLIISALDERQRGLELGATKCLLKPVSQEQIQRALSQIILADIIQKPEIEVKQKGEQIPSTKSPLILIAEDEENIISVLVDYLEAKNYQTIIAHNGKQAFEQAKNNKPDIILMDIQMPEMDGLEAISRLRNIPKLESTPIIALTALAMAGDRERCLAAGANDYLSKPINMKQLLETIENHLV